MSIATPISSWCRGGKSPGAYTVTETPQIFGSYDAYRDEVTVSTDTDRHSHEVEDDRPDDVMLIRVDGALRTIDQLVAEGVQILGMPDTPEAALSLRALLLAAQQLGKADSIDWDSSSRYC